MKKSKIFFITTSVYPFVKDGRNAEFASSLPSYLQQLGHEVRVLMPKYTLINERKHIIRDIIRMKDMPLMWHGNTVTVSVKSGFIPETKTQIYFVEYEKYFKRADLYRDKRTGDYFKDNDERFTFLGRVAIETLKILGWQPDIVHCCDWHTGVIPPMIREEQKQTNFFKKSIVTYSALNPAEAGLFEKSAFEKNFASAKVIDRDKCLHKGKLSFLKSGVMYSDAVTIPEFFKSEKLNPDVENILGLSKQTTEVGFGGDHNYWTPVNNNSLYKSYSIEKFERKAANREGFFDDKRTGFSPEQPIIGILAEQLSEQGKTIAQFLKAVKDIKLQFFILADAPASSSQPLKPLIGKNPNHTFFSMTDPDDYFRHNFYAVSDFLFIPPSDDHADLHYLNGIHFGCIPILPDTAVAGNLMEPIKDKSGFALKYSDEKDLAKKLESALELYSDKEKFESLVKKAMKTDVSWAAFTAPVIRMYEKAFARMK